MAPRELPVPVGESARNMEAAIANEVAANAIASIPAGPAEVTPSVESVPDAADIGNLVTAISECAEGKTVTTSDDSRRRHFTSRLVSGSQTNFKKHPRPFHLEATASKTSGGLQT